MLNRYYMWNIKEESAEHLLLHCLRKYPVVAGILPISIGLGDALRHKRKFIEFARIFHRKEMKRSLNGYYLDIVAGKKLPL